MALVSFSTPASASRSARSRIPPVGLEGKGSTTALVRGVRAARSCAAVRRNSFSAFSSTYTGVPPAMAVRGP